MFWVISSDGISWEKLACAKEKSTVLKAQCFQFAATCFKLATYLRRSGTGRRAHWGACVEVWEGKREKVGARTKSVWLTCPTVVLFTYLAQFTQTNAQKHNCINKLFSCESRSHFIIQIPQPHPRILLSEDTRLWWKHLPECTWLVLLTLKGNILLFRLITTITSIFCTYQEKEI